MNNSYKSVINDKIAMDMLRVLDEESGLALNVTHGKVAPQKASIYSHYQKLLREKLVTNEGHTRPLILHITERGRRLVRPAPLRISVPAKVAVPARSIVALPSVPPMRELNCEAAAELARLHMEVAVLLECIARIHQDSNLKAA
jgi:hypothetical protein